MHRVLPSNLTHCMASSEPSEGLPLLAFNPCIHSTHAFIQPMHSFNTLPLSSAQACELRVFPHPHLSPFLSAARSSYLARPKPAAWTAAWTMMALVPVLVRHWGPPGSWPP